MADNLDDVFTEDQALDAPEPVVEAAPAPEAEPGQPDPQTDVQPEPVAPDRPEPGFVPLAVVLDTREKLRAAEAELATFRQQQPQQPQAPDPYDDPQGYAQHVEQRIEQRETAMRFQFSDQFARQTHGADAVEAATTWAQDKAKADPAFAMSYMREQNPIDWIVQQHKRDGLLQQIGSDPDEYVRRRAVELGLTAPVAAAPIPAAVIPQQASTPVRVPRSLATLGASPSDIRDVATGPLAATDAVFT